MFGLQRFERSEAVHGILHFCVGLLITASGTFDLRIRRVGKKF